MTLKFGGKATTLLGYLSLFSLSKVTHLYISYSCPPSIYKSTAFDIPIHLALNPKFT